MRRVGIANISAGKGHASALILRGQLHAKILAHSEISSGGVLPLINLSHASLHSWTILVA